MNWAYRSRFIISRQEPASGTRSEHRLFSFITQNWRAKPLLSYRVIVELIGATTTQTGLTVRCELDTKAYPKGIVVSDEQMKGLNIQPQRFHGEWNYSISPSNPIDQSS